MRRAIRPPCRARPVPKGLDPLRCVGDAGPRVAPPPHEVGHVADGQLVGDHRLDLVPGERGRDLPARAGPGEPGAEDGLVRCVLVEVHEDATPALLLPPVGGDQRRKPPLQFVGQRDGGGPHLLRSPNAVGAAGTRASPLFPVVFG